MIDLIFDAETQLVSIDKSSFFTKVQTALAEGYFLRKRRRDIRRAKAGMSHLMKTEEDELEEAEIKEVQPAEVQTAPDEGEKEKHHQGGGLLAVLDDGIGYIARFFIMLRLPVVENRIVFSTFQNVYTCNCRYIAEEMRKRLEQEVAAKDAEAEKQKNEQAPVEENEKVKRTIEEEPYQLIFIVNRAVYANKDQYDIPSDIWLVQRGSIASFIALGTAKYWVDNALNCIWKNIRKKKRQIYLNTWHGSLGIKRLNGDKHWVRLAKKSNRKISAFITNSTFEEEVFQDFAFWSRVPCLQFGHPRNDILLNEKYSIAMREKVYGYYRIPEHAKTVLYAPTFRDNKSDVSAIRIDCVRLKKAMEIKFGGEWTVMVRAHMHNRHNVALRQMFNAPGVIDASDYNDMQELLAVVDAGITDYSSWIFDFVLTGRPGFIYARDIDQYIHSRGFYYDLDKTPFSIASNDDELVANIAAFDETEYAKNVQAFLKEKGCYEQGNAAKQVADMICDGTFEQKRAEAAARLKAKRKKQKEERRQKRSR